MRTRLDRLRGDRGDRVLLWLQGGQLLDELVRPGGWWAWLQEREGTVT